MFGGNQKKKKSEEQIEERWSGGRRRELPALRAREEILKRRQQDRFAMPFKVAKKEFDRGSAMAMICAQWT